MTKIDKLAKRAEALTAKKNLLFANMDIASPMSDSEKALTKEIAGIWSDVFDLIRKNNAKRKTQKNTGA